MKNTEQVIFDGVLLAICKSTIKEVSLRQREKGN